ncbi:restriction endonuclease subunit S [Mycoplasma sp. VS292A]
MQKDKLVPDVRFKGFEEEWKTNRLCEVALKFDNLRIPVSESLRIKGPYPYYGANGVQDYVSGFTHNGEFVLIAEDGANDLDSYPSNYVNGKFWANNHVHVLQGFKDTLDNKFLNYSFTNVNFKPLLTGGDRAKLTASALDTINIKVPIFNEQRKIGSLLNNIDQLLLFQKSKLEKLQIIKQSLLNKMFASDDQKIPEIRFKGFVKPWSRTNLQRISFLRGRIGFRGYKKTDFVDRYRGAISLSPSDIDENGLVSFANNSFISIDKYEESPEIKVKIGDIIFTKTASIGKIGYISYLPYLATINPQFALISVFPDKADSYFVYLCISNKNFLLNVSKITAGSSVPTMSQEKLKSIKFRTPKIIEQQKIGQFFSSLDSLIHSQEQKLEKLNNIKQALLEKMFC